MFNHHFSYLNPIITLERLRDANDERNKDMAESINKTLTKIKNIVKNVPKDLIYLGLKRMKKKLILLKGFLSLIAKIN